MAFKPGEPRHPEAGRKAGTPNKRSAQMLESVFTVYERMGGDNGFFRWAQKNPDAFYNGCLKVLPKNLTLTGDSDLPKSFTINVVKANDAELPLRKIIDADPED